MPATAPAGVVLTGYMAGPVGLRHPGAGLARIDHWKRWWNLFVAMAFLLRPVVGWPTPRRASFGLAGG